MMDNNTAAVWILGIFAVTLVAIFVVAWVSGGSK
jgi:hypothetical protein